MRRDQGRRVSTHTLTLKHTHVGHQQETHEIEAEAQSGQEQGLVERVPSQLRKLVQHGCGDALHVAELCGAARRESIKRNVLVGVCWCVCEKPYQRIDTQHKEHQEEHDGPKH